MPPKTRTSPARYGIAEWYGKDIRTLTPEQRQSFGQMACRHEDEGGHAANAPVCPFLSRLVPNVRCNKAGGVCSLRKFNVAANGAAVAVAGDKIVTTCPNRFVQDVADSKTVFQWIAEKMLDLPAPTIVKETPFLRKVSDAVRTPDVQQDMEEEAEEEGKKAGRIDWILINPTTVAENADLEWCAVESQALYFSGGRMRDDFETYAAAPSEVLLPFGKRRPDYRSSGPKRLAPQLDVKIPVLRAWGKKVAILIDRYFFEQMNRLADAYPRARDDRERRDNAEVVWFVVDYDEELRLRPSTIVYTTLESSHRALNATEPLSKAQFTANLRAVVGNSARGNKVFKATVSESSALA